MTSCNIPPLHHPTSPFHQLPIDCINIISHYHVYNLYYGDSWDLTDDIVDSSFYNLESKGMGDANWNFLKKFAHCCHFVGENRLLEFLSACRDWQHKRTFYYLRLSYFSLSGLCESGAVQYLRGIHELYFKIPSQSDEDEPYLEPLFRNIRGVKKLSIDNGNGTMLGPITFKHLENLRGIQQAYFDYCRFSIDAFQNLRGIRSLTLESCYIQHDAHQTQGHLFQNLRGIQKLILFECHGNFLSVQDFKNIRGVKILRIVVYDDDPEQEDEFLLQCKHLEHLRGIEELNICEAQKLDIDPTVPSLTDESFKNLRGARKVILRNVVSDRVSDAALVHLRGAVEIFIPDIAEDEG